MARAAGRAPHAGRPRPGPWPGQDERITVAGFVDDLAAVYAAADCVAVPLLESGGTPLKFVEALAYGVPVVATPPGRPRASRSAPGEHFLAGDGADAFAARVADVLARGAPGLAARARALPKAEYRSPALAARIAAPVSGLTHVVANFTV